ncbi:hypothetical protein C1E24_04245 [Pseudoalteromonas phenolica]|uniref:HTH araC/xylS-type domain-containing protein n=1 Tax=Pseudoalteromonas phenolica TaxID=161398 RepID=A0A5R9Q4D7_9GAMM|nr:AraC family transcriptional regulator [Pseudoalteromonas phenolica]TLX48020.1 hypothetical protein C1E24_04245 [Pseudoalteromonas phenolica]
MVQSRDYFDLPPPAWLSHSVEVFWCQKLSEHTFFIPQGVFDLLLHSQPIAFSKFDNQLPIKQVPAGTSILGQQISAYTLYSKHPQWIFGVRLKPFSFLKQQFMSSLEVKNTIESITQLLSHSGYLNDVLPLLTQLNENHINIQMQVLIEKITPWLHSQFIANDYVISEPLRAETNAILNARGDIKISDMCETFSISKVTLRQHFLDNIGLLPKELCKIWRLNNFLLHSQSATQTLTESAINAGYFDQAHLNREFKSLLGQTPKRYLNSTEPHLNQGFQAAINNRFIGKYDPF